MNDKTIFEFNGRNGVHFPQIENCTCGNPGKLFYNWLDFGITTYYRVECGTHCGDWCKTKHKAIINWNTRRDIKC